MDNRIEKNKMKHQSNLHLFPHQLTVINNQEVTIMSESVVYKGHRVNIGTCENLYYTTYQELKDLLPSLGYAEGNLRPVDYLNPQYPFRYRFPFYGEKRNFAGYEDYDRSFLVTIPKADAPGEIFIKNHYESEFRVDKSQRFKYTMKLKCLADESRNYDIKEYFGTPDLHSFEIVQQTQHEGELKTIIRCPFCGAKSLLSRTQIFLIHKIVNDPAHLFDEETKQNIEEAVKGYKRELILINSGE